MNSSCKTKIGLDGLDNGFLLVFILILPSEDLVFTCVLVLPAVDFKPLALSPGPITPNNRVGEAYLQRGNHPFDLF